jgi:hypothetical protein
MSYAPIRAVTELGDEKRCLTCGEYWPADYEFFEPMRKSRDGLSTRCIACTKAKTWQFSRAVTPPPTLTARGKVQLPLSP